MTEIFEDEYLTIEVEGWGEIRRKEQKTVIDEIRPMLADWAQERHRLRFTESDARRLANRAFGRLIMKLEGKELQALVERTVRENLERQVAELRHRTRAEVSPKLRFRVFKRDSFRCRYCGASADEGARLELDHVVPISKGGTNDMANLRTACFNCNRGKGSESL